MKVYEPAQLRNVGIFGHGSTGKTSLLEAILYNAGTTTRMGSVEDGNTVGDFEPEEKSKAYSTSASVAYCQWDKHLINLIDTPGGANFISEAHFAMAVVDAVLMTVCAGGGVEVQTEKLWELATKMHLPRAFFINKIDRERADFEKTIKDIKDTFRINLILLQLPIGGEDSFEGIIDVLSGKAYRFDEKGKAQPMDAPADMADRIEEARVQALESIAENDEKLMDKYLDGEDLQPDEIFAVLKKSVSSGEAYPVLCGSATKNIGIPMLLDLFVNAFPSPADRPPYTGRKADSEETVERANSVKEPFSAVLFKTSSSYAGTLSFLRVLSGKAAHDSGVFNPVTDTAERLSGMVKICGKNTESIGEASAGDIVGVTKLKKSRVGDTLCDAKTPVVFALIDIPNPPLNFSVRPKGKGNEDKIISGLLKIGEDDPTIRVQKDAQTKEIILSGMGTGHIEVTLEKLAKRFKIEAVLSTPKVPYQETIKGQTNSRYRHKKQTGGRGQFGECEIVLSPLPRGTGYEFVDKIVGGVIPKTFIPAVDKGIRESAERGPLAGYPTVDFQVKLIDGKTHDVDSSEQAFKTAGSFAFKQGILKANPVLLEPINKMEITAPEKNTGDIMGDLSGRRGQVLGYETKGKNTVIRALVPLGEILRYEPDLRSMTGGCGVFTSDFDHYQEVPNELAQKVIQAAKKEDEAE